MFKHIEKIQQKSEHERKRIALIVTVVLFIFVIIFWIVLDSLSTTTKGDVEDKINAPSPFMNIKDTFGNMLNDVKEKAEDVEDYDFDTDLYDNISQ